MKGRAKGQRARKRASAAEWQLRLLRDRPVAIELPDPRDLPADELLPGAWRDRL